MKVLEGKVFVKLGVDEAIAEEHVRQAQTA